MYTPPAEQSPTAPTARHRPDTLPTRNRQQRDTNMREIHIECVQLYRFPFVLASQRQAHQPEHCNALTLDRRRGPNTSHAAGWPTPLRSRLTVTNLQVLSVSIVASCIACRSHIVLAHASIVCTVTPCRPQKSSLPVMVVVKRRVALLPECAAVTSTSTAMSL
jgi:hypothetical protein